MTHPRYFLSWNFWVLFENLWVFFSIFNRNVKFFHSIKFSIYYNTFLKTKFGVNVCVIFDTFENFFEKADFSRSCCLIRKKFASSNKVPDISENIWNKSFGYQSKRMFLLSLIFFFEILEINKETQKLFRFENISLYWIVWIEYQKSKKSQKREIL